MNRDIEGLNARLNQLLSQNIAHGAMLTAALGALAFQSTDWRNQVDEFRMMAEWTVRNLEWDGPQQEGEAMRADALAYLHAAFDQLHHALLRAEGEEPPPGLGPASQPSS